MTPFLVPDSDDAHDWVYEELSKSVYSGRSTLWEWIKDQLLTIFEWFLEQTGSQEKAFLTISLIALIVGTAIALLVVARRARPRKGSSPHASMAVWQADDDRSFDELVAAAQQAAQQGDYSLALVEQFRGLALRAHNRGIIHLAPGATAHEVATNLGRAVAPLAPSAHRLGNAFNIAFYGSGQATAEDYQLALSMTDTLPAGRVGERS